MSLVRRALTAAPGSIGLLLASLAAPVAPTSAVAGGAVVVKIDHRAQTITFVVRMSVYPACAEPRCAITPAIAEDIRIGIENVWNKASTKYRCYTVRVKPEIDVVPGPPGEDSDRVGVRIDRSPVPIRSFVQATGIGGQPLSSDPTSLLRPSNLEGAWGRSSWAYPPAAPTPNGGLVTAAGLYAHEFAHVLGLDDTYDENGNDIPGSPHDILNRGMYDNPPKIHPATLDRLVLRHGIKPDDLQCAWKLRYNAGGVTAKGVKCGSPVGTWPLRMKIAAALHQEFGLTIRIEKNLKGTWRQTFTVGVDIPTGRAQRSGSQTGTASFSYGPPPTMTVSHFGAIQLKTLATCPR